MPIIVGENCYISVDDANTYFADRLFTDSWDNATNDDKAKALIMASKKVDRQPLIGRRAAEDQKMEFPRAIYSYNRENFYWFDSYFITEEGNKYISNYQRWVTETEISQNVKNAVCEEALLLLEYGNSKRIKLQRQGVKSFNAGGISETYSNITIRLLSLEAKEFLRPYTANSVEIY